MTTPTAEALLDLERKIESDVIECRRLLDLGLDEAVDELRRTCSEAGLSSSNTAERLKQMADQSCQHLKTVQKSLGMLNLAMNQFVLTDGLTLENINTFDKWRDRVLSELHTAQEAIQEIQLDGDMGWKLELMDVWRRFRHQLEVIRVHMALDEQHAEAELQAERERLMKRVTELEDDIEKNPHEVRRLLHELGSEAKKDPNAPTLGGWVKALLMWQDQPVPEEIKQMNVKQAAGRDS
tara:strand:- start:100 stop:813 length:714 start_codon:yes stop_codon:yes gene_type:complete